MAAFREMLDAEFHERVAREHVEGGMSVVELRRNHDVPLSAVRKWIELFQSGGPEAIRAAAEHLARVQRKPPSAKALQKLRDALVNPADDERSLQARLDAVVTVGVRRIHALADDIENLVPQSGVGIEALLTLGDLGELDRIDRVAAQFGPGNQGWVDGARERALRVRGT
ncbi:transposase [Myxococcus sp. MxC21-1]|uniref:transposase n=1 Tax=Myxococcus sp. MxC21-1 TaxID=3041439 RepID=UPI00292CFE92|nr:transposase [Myxococcus sp. MxC21-1]WNZ60914.1 transposase [Myxococcus sp. MxC21-1]